MARERQAHQEGIELSQSVHDTTAQTAYMIGLGIDGAMRLAGDPNPKLTERLGAAAALSRSAMWELRRPIDMGRIFEGRDLACVLGAHTATFADAGRKLVARVPGRPDRPRFPKDDFVIGMEAGSCTCPARQATHKIVLAERRTDEMGRVHRLRAFQFDGSECMTRPLRSQCISPRGRKGRWVLSHPQEALLQEARALQQNAGYDEYRERRVAMEHRLARLVHLGIRQYRYFCRAKTKFQLYLAATVANLTLVAGNSDGRARPVAVQTTAALSVRRPFLPSSISSRRGPVNS